MEKCGTWNPKEQERIADYFNTILAKNEELLKDVFDEIDLITSLNEKSSQFLKDLVMQSGGEIRVIPSPNASHIELAISYDELTREIVIRNQGKTPPLLAEQMD